MIIYHPFNGYGGSQLMTKNLMEIFKKSSQNENLFCIVGFGMEGFIKADKVLFDISNKYLRILSLGILSFFLNFYFVFSNKKILGITFYSIHSLFLPSLFKPKNLTIYLHEIPSSKLPIALLEFYSKRRIKIIYVSEYHKKQVGVSGDVIYNYVEKQEISNYKARANNRIVFVGSGNHKKGFDIFLDICEEFNDEKYTFDAYLNSCTESLKKRARTIGVSVNIGVKEKEEFFRNGGVLLQPSRAKETFNLVNLEAASFGIPVISFGQEITNEIFSDFNLNFDLENRKNFQEAILILERLMIDKVYYSRLSDNFKKQSERFSQIQFEEKVKNYIN